MHYFEVKGCRKGIILKTVNSKNSKNTIFHKTCKNYMSLSYGQSSNLYASYTMATVSWMILVGKMREETKIYTHKFYSDEK